MRFLENWQDQRRRAQLARKIEAARRAGHGVHVQEWRLDGNTDQDGLDGHDTGAVEDRVTAWCRDVLARCRRPWGIDQFDLTIAWADGDGRPARKVQLRRLRPADLYGAEPLADQLRTLLHGGEAAAVRTHAGAVHVVAALFSWGDAVHAAMPATA